MSEQQEDLSTQRIEAFSDGVFAIAITLLVLEIKVPHPGSGHSLLEGLLGLWPSYLGYILSFLTIGIYWANHHWVFKLYKGTDHIFNLLNVFFLMCVSFLPFPTAVLAAYVNDPANCDLATSFYCFGLLLCGLSWLFKWLYAAYGSQIVDQRLEPEFVRRTTWQYVISLMLYTLALTVSFWKAWVGLAIASALTGLYLLPPGRPKYQRS